MKVKPIEEIINFLTPFATNQKVEIVDVEFKLGKEPALTIYIDTENGVDLDTLERFHNTIDAPLDELDPSFGAAYTLNVSSPGVDRPFKTDRDFERNLNKPVEVKLFAPIKGKKLIEGKMVAFDKNTVTVLVKGVEMKLERNQIAKINQQIVF